VIRDSDNHAIKYCDVTVSPHTSKHIKPSCVSNDDVGRSIPTSHFDPVFQAMRVITFSVKTAL
jgi:hypothetical protein